MGGARSRTELGTTDNFWTISPESETSSFASPRRRRRLSKNNFPSVSRLNKIISLSHNPLKVLDLGPKVFIKMIPFSCPTLGMKLNLESLFTRVMNGKSFWQARARGAFLNSFVGQYK